MLKLDIGCGAAKRPSFIGIDVEGNPDIKCDITVESSPFADASADHIYSSHCLEHLPDISLVRIFRELTRVAADGATIEFWHPYAFHRDAILVGHISSHCETTYEHMGCKYRELWKESLGGQWMLQEFRYVIEPVVLSDLKKAGVDLEFAVRYLHDIVKEMGTFIQIDRTNTEAPRWFAAWPAVTGRRHLCISKTGQSLPLTKSKRAAKDN